MDRDLIIQAETDLGNIGLENINAALLAKKISLPSSKERPAFDVLIRQGAFVKVAEMYVYRKTIQNIAWLDQQHFSSNPTITVAELRDMLNTSRQVALPVLEYLDMHKYTIRVGSFHRPTQRLRDFSE